MKLASKKPILILIIVLLAVNMFHEESYGQRKCEPMRVCAMPGDFLKYAHASHTGNGTTFHQFGNLIGAEKIIINSAYTWPDSTEQESYILDLKTGLTDQKLEESFLPFIDMVTVPIVINRTNIDPNTSVSESVVRFGDSTREVIISKGTSTDTDVDSSYAETVYDKETGVLISMNIRAEGTVLQDRVSLWIETKLIDTNIFDNNKAKIPSWIKNNAKWWSEGSIGDGDFIKGMEYLISQGVMKIPPTSAGTDSASQIPSWIKNNAGWWADGQISDDDFVMGIQYLISNGIMRIT